jgi:glutaredoxin 3
MEIENPSEFGFTIYSKSGCPNCIKVKKLLKDNNINFNLINSDEYIIEDKDFFINFIKEISNTEVKTFPIIFYDKKFIGGYGETIKYVDELILAFDNIF